MENCLTPYNSNNEFEKVKFLLSGAIPNDPMLNTEDVFGVNALPSEYLKSSAH